MQSLAVVPGVEAGLAEGVQYLAGSSDVNTSIHIGLFTTAATDMAGCK